MELSRWTSDALGGMMACILTKSSANTDRLNDVDNVEITERKRERERDGESEKEKERDRQRERMRERE